MFSFDSGFRFFRGFLPAEAAHEAAIFALKFGLGRFVGVKSFRDFRLSVSLFGLDFLNPLGMAAGFDKNGEVFSDISSLGFGFVEIGTITPLAQAGNAPPRIFRLESEHGVINRLGLNNDGHQRVYDRVSRRAPKAGILGINIGANNESADLLSDYLAGLSYFYDVADYMTVNISCPNVANSAGLREMASIKEILSGLCARRSILRETHGKLVPLLVKFSPDMDGDVIPLLGAICLDLGIDGAILCNTTLNRDGLKHKDVAHGDERGGLSGRPLFRRSTAFLARFYETTGGKIPLIGVGGIEDGDTAWEKFCAGASLIQLYTSLIYAGPGLPVRILRALVARLKEEGYSSIEEIVGTKSKEWSSML